MLETLFRRNRSAYLESPFRCELEAFAQWLQAKGYTRTCTCDHLFRLRRALGRIDGATSGARFSLTQLQDGFTAPRQAALHRGTQHAYQRFLAQCGRLDSGPDADPFARLYQRYADYLTKVSGLVASTCTQHVSTITEFLRFALGTDRPLRSLSADDIARFVAHKSKQVRRQTLQHTVAQLRAFLRYLYEQHEITVPLASIDTPRTYRDELLPRALDWNCVQKLLQSIDRSSRMGWRDYVVLHLMAYYGLRPSEVAALTLDAIDWETASVRIRQRKTRSDLILPLAAPTLRLLRRYLRCGRPGTGDQALFLRTRCPRGGITHYTVGDLYKKRARESGLPLEGTSSYALRHAFAMRLLHRGVGLKTIGDLLGHRTLESTCVYLRLDLEMLRGVALPVPRAIRSGGHRHGA